MTKKFDNLAEDGIEHALRRGFTVPNGAVNLAWVKSPSLTPGNNVIIVDTSKVVAENSNTGTRNKKLAFANALGILEDENGNEIWDEEYPVISDLFSIADDELNIADYTSDQILPFLHVSRHFHIDYAGLAFGALERSDDLGVRVVDKNGSDHVDENGVKRYKVYIIQPTDLQVAPNSRQSLYRVHVFLDMIPDADELYLTYDKVELSAGGGIRNQEIEFKERINPRPYYNYVPEESEVIDAANIARKIYSSKPATLKNQILGMPQGNTYGWKYYAPRKAIPDPRIFQLFRWRLACEFTQPIVSNPTGPVNNNDTIFIRAGVVIPPNGTHDNTRANFFFYQLNESDFNFSGIKFVNPLVGDGFNYTRQDQQTASYWHVDLANISLDDLNKFDVLIWAPNAVSPSTSFSDMLAKINYFTENVGGTFIYETSSITRFSSSFTDITYSNPLTGSRLTPSPTDFATSSSIRLYDATPDDDEDTFNSFGMWQQWPPNVSNILNQYTDIGSILASADVIAGWTLDEEELATISGYDGIPNAKFQYITDYSPAVYSVVAEAMETVDSTYKPVLLHRKFNSGGNVFVSTSCLFEDHLFQANGDMAVKSLNIANISQLMQADQTNFRQMVSSQYMSAEMKLRLNVMLFATINKPAPKRISNTAQLTNNGNTQSVTIYTDWKSSWVINPANGVLSDAEKAEAGFALLPVNPDDTDPVWQKALSQKTLKQLIQEKIKQVDPLSTNSVYNTFEGATKRYFLMVTNPLVQVQTTNLLSDTSVPTVWTTAYSPRFEVPTHLGSYVLRNEMISGTGVGEGKRIYPPKSYELQSNVSYMTDSTTQGKINATISLTGTIVKYVKAADQQETRQVWVPAQAGALRDIILHSHTDGYPELKVAAYKHQGPLTRPFDIDTWSDVNYRITPTTNWPYPGIHGTLSVAGGDRGALVTLVQQILNQLIFFGQLSQPYLKEDGIYGRVTERKVIAFQTSREAQFISDYGIIDAQTWSLLGYALIWLSTIPGWNANVPVLAARAAIAKSYMRIENISDDNINSCYARASWEGNGPSTIKEGFILKFKEQFPVYKVSIMPMLYGTLTNKMSIDWLDLTPSASLLRYNYSRGLPGAISNKSGSDGTWIDINVNEVLTDTVIFRATQTGKAGWGTSRFIGIRDVAVYAKKYFQGAPGHYVDETVTVPGGTYEIEVPFTYTANIEFEAGVPKVLHPILGVDNLISIGDSISDVRWDVGSLTISPPELEGFFDVEFVEEVVTAPDPRYRMERQIPGASRSGVASSSNFVRLTYQGYNNSLSAAVFQSGPRIGSGQYTYWTQNKDGVLDPYSRTYGWITKDDGLKLICKANHQPYGFPTALPTNATTSLHFARFRLNSFNTDQTLYYGFYDVVRNEFITNAYGEPEVSYYDYIRRGPQNIFIAVQTTYELDTSSNLPGSTDPVEYPFQWAMPVYGVTLGLKSKIQIEPLSPDLGNHDLWGIPIKTGSFAKNIVLRPKSEGSLTNYLKDYQGTTVTAYYDIPEAKNSAWSQMHGRPYVDIVGEVPIIIDDDTIKIRQYPILITQVPTATPSEADPWYPEFQVYRRDTLLSDWVEVPMTGIKDYDAWHGTIQLNTPLTSNDPRLVKVDYTSERKVFDLRHDGTQRINLNPYTNNKPEWINKPLYIYILPEYVVDKNTQTITDSVRTRTLQLAESTSIFLPNQVDYDPTAVLLGIVYISSSFDVDDLIILDTRQRGGGVSPRYKDTEIRKVQPESDSYWDTEPNTAVTYQKGGFVIIRLPETLKEDFTEDQIKAIVERNITIGVRYKIEFVEDLDGDAPGYLLADDSIVLTSDLISILWGDL
jgi:hypothetical protein